MPYDIATVKLMGGPLDGSRHQYLKTDLEKSSRLEIRSMGRIHRYTLSHQHSDDFWDAVYNAPRESIIDKEDGIGGFGYSRLDY